MGFGKGGEEGIPNGLTLAVAIGLQDAPEGWRSQRHSPEEGLRCSEGIWIATLAGASSNLWEGWRV